MFTMVGMNIPMMITLVRLAAIPFVAFFYYMSWRWAHPLASMVFIVAAVSDWLDGYLARHLNQETRFGAFLDPVADKLLVVVSLVMIVGHHDWAWIPLPAAIIISRELVISALREWMAEMGKRASIAVNWIGKAKKPKQNKKQKPKKKTRKKTKNKK